MDGKEKSMTKMGKNVKASLIYCGRNIDWLAERGTHYPIEIHTMNPMGCENMQREIDRYWK